MLETENSRSRGAAAAPGRLSAGCQPQRQPQLGICVRLTYNYSFPPIVPLREKSQYMAKKNGTLQSFSLVRRLSKSSTSCTSSDYLQPGSGRTLVDPGFMSLFYFYLGDKATSRSCSDFGSAFCPGCSAYGDSLSLQPPWPRLLSGHMYEAIQLTSPLAELIAGRTSRLYVYTSWF